MRRHSLWTALKLHFLFQKGIVKIYFENSIVSVGFVSKYLRIKFFAREVANFQPLASFSNLFLKTIFNPSFKLFFPIRKCLLTANLEDYSKCFFNLRFRYVKIKLLAEFKLKTKIIQNHKKSNCTKLTN